MPSSLIDSLRAFISATDNILWALVENMAVALIDLRTPRRICFNVGPMHGWLDLI